MLIISVVIFLSLNAWGDANGKPVINNVSCSAGLFSAADKLCELFETFGSAELCKIGANNCVEGSQDIFTGNQIELASPNNIKSWTGFGGLGLPYLGANLCLLRDLKDMSLESQAQATTPIGKVSVKQKVTFYSFNREKYEWVGYHSAKACVPVFGCLDVFNQKITATAINTNLTNAGKKAGEYAVYSAHALEVKTDGLAQNLKVTIPAIKVDTPYGQVSAKPEFDFGRAIGFQLAPYNLGNSKSLLAGPWGKAKLKDVYGINPGTDFIENYPTYYVLGSRTLDNRQIGYLSQVAFGSRDANPKKAAWAPAGNEEYPVRPDGDFETARSQLEKLPNAYMAAAVEVAYSPTDLLPSAIRNNQFISIDFKVFAKPMIDAGITSQFNISNSEISVGKKLLAPAGPLDYRPMFMEQYKGLSMSAGTSAAGRFSLSAGVDLKLHLHVPLPWPFDDVDISLINIHPKTTVAEVIDVGYGKGNRQAQAFSQSSKILASKNVFQQYKSFNGYSGDGQEHIKACLAAPNATGKLPDAPEYTPGNPEDLTQNILYPCNICIAMNSFSYKDEQHKDHTIDGFLQVLFPVTQANMPANVRWVCDNVSESGCYDMCSYDPLSNKLTVVKTAKGMRAAGEATDGPARCH